MAASPLVQKRGPTMDPAATADVADLVAADAPQAEVEERVLVDEDEEEDAQGFVDTPPLERPTSRPAGPTRPAYPVFSMDLEDRREERRRQGVLKWKLEKGVPDVGGPGWRSRTGHLLKNQSYYTAQPGHLWDNPTHAGPKTWRAYHGPKLRGDAPLMERLDRLDAQELEFEAKKAFVNAVRVQTLDRFYHQKLENGQKEMASRWTPHRRARGEIHKLFEGLEAELDSMPLKELKKVLSPVLLRGDREAILHIARHLREEDLWKEEWKAVEKVRHDDMRLAWEQRVAYNDMLTDLAGQPPRCRDPNHVLPNHCTPRLEEMAKPSTTRPLANVTHRSDFRGLVHVDHQVALEACFPGQGLKVASTIVEIATETAKIDRPPPPLPESLSFSSRQGSLLASASGKLRTLSAPAGKGRAIQAPGHVDGEALSQHARAQLLATAGAQPTEQGKGLYEEAIEWELHHLEAVSLAGSARGSSVRSQGLVKNGSQVDLAPAPVPLVYEVCVPSAEPSAERPGWRPRRFGGPVPRKSPPRRRGERHPPVETPDAEPEGYGMTARPSGTVLSLSMPGAPPTMKAVCQDLDDFEATLRPMAVTGNFWMTPRTGTPALDLTNPPRATSGQRPGSAQRPLSGQRPGSAQRQVSTSTNHTALGGAALQRELGSGSSGTGGRVGGRLSGPPVPPVPLGGLG